jgi:ferritin
VEPIGVALEQERKVTEQISGLTAIARDEGDYVSEQFMQWFLREQVEEIDLMSSLLAVAERSKERPMEIEEYIAREGLGTGEADPAAPPEAGAPPSRGAGG